MKGHRQIVALRKRGLKPAAVFVEDRMCAAVEWEVAQGGLPAVYVGDDNPALADLRFLKGCRVHLWADTEPRASAWAERLRKAGAVEIIQATRGEVSVWRA